MPLMLYLKFYRLKLCHVFIKWKRLIYGSYCGNKAAYNLVPGGLGMYKATAHSQSLTVAEEGLGTRPGRVELLLEYMRGLIQADTG